MQAAIQCVWPGLLPDRIDIRNEWDPSYDHFPKVQFLGKGGWKPPRPPCIRPLKSPFLHMGVSEQYIDPVDGYPHLFVANPDAGAISAILYDRWLRSHACDSRKRADVKVAVITYPVHTYFGKNRTRDEQMCAYAQKVDRKHRDDPRFVVTQLQFSALGSPDTYPCSVIRPPLEVRMAWEYPYPLEAFPLMPMPVPSSVRWSTQLEKNQVAPWRSVHARPVKFSFIGSRNTALKGEILDFCLGNSDICKVLELHRGNFSGLSETDRTRETMLLKSQSTFCLEPPGLSFGRKSQVDAILMGCIPVFFRDTRNFMPLHFWWKDNASVVLTETDLTRSHLEELLRDTARIELMQRTIAKHAHSLVYAFDDYPGDAVDIFSRHLAAHVRRSMRHSEL